MLDGHRPSYCRRVDGIPMYLILCNISDIKLTDLAFHPCVSGFSCSYLAINGPVRGGSLWVTLEFNVLHGTYTLPYLALGVAFIILQAILDLHPKHSTDYFNWVTKVVEGCYFCMTVATSILASLSIGWKIYTHSRHNQYSKAKYNSIIEIVVQSSSIYAFACLVEGIIAFSSTGNSHIVFYYISPISIFATVTNPCSFLLEDWLLI